MSLLPKNNEFEIFNTYFEKIGICDYGIFEEYRGVKESFIRNSQLFLLII